MDKKDIFYTTVIGILVICLALNTYCDIKENQVQETQQEVKTDFLNTLPKMGQ